jgi:DUF917 family protein
MGKIDVKEMENLATGAAVLGTGGGGDPHIGKLMAQQAIAENESVDLIDPEDVPDEVRVIPSAMMGAPTVLYEKAPAGDESARAVERVARELGEEVYATMPMECGGVNSTIPFAVAATLGIPVVDADGMGRAFPELQHETFNVYGVSGTPAVVADEKGNNVLLETEDNLTLEDYARAVTIRMGGQAALSDYPMTGREVKETGIANTTTLAINIGEAIRHGDDALEGIKVATAETDYGRAIELFRGKIVDVERRTEGGFAVGQVEFEGIDTDEDSSMTIEFQNENLIARLDGEIVATVPDLITVLELETGKPITTENLRYGYRVIVLGIPTPEIMRTDAALEVWGPRSFGYDVDYRELERRYPDYYRAHGVPHEKSRLLE